MVAIIRVGCGTVVNPVVTLVMAPWGPDQQEYVQYKSPVAFKFLKPESNTPFLITTSAAGKSDYIYQGNISDGQTIRVTARMRKVVGV